MPFVAIAVVALWLIWSVGMERVVGPRLLGLPIIPSTAMGFVAAWVWAVIVVLG